MLNELTGGVTMILKQVTAYCHCVGHCTNNIDYFVGYCDGTYDVLN